MNKSFIGDALHRTRHESPSVRRTALLDLCPCRVKANVPEVWDRLVQMHADPDPSVRSVVLHALCDGSPSDRHREVVAAVDAMQQDPDRKLRRRARRTMAAYRRTGDINQE